MQLNEIKALMAATLLSGRVMLEVNNEERVLMVPHIEEIEAAVRVAQEIWEETVRQE